MRGRGGGCFRPMEREGGKGHADPWGEDHSWTATASDRMELKEALDTKDEMDVRHKDAITTIVGRGDASGWGTRKARTARY